MKRYIAILFASIALLGGCASTGGGMMSSYNTPQGGAVAPQIMGQPQRYYDGRPVVSHQPMLGQVVQAGSGLGGIGKCELIGAGLGAIAGNLAGGMLQVSKTATTLVGAFLGGLAGNKYCENEKGEIVQVLGVQQQVISKNDMTNIEKQHVPATGCGVRVQGYSIKEFPGQQGHSCETDRAEFTSKYMAQCHGKGGSLAKDVLCGRSL